MKGEVYYLDANVLIPIIESPHRLTTSQRSFVAGLESGAVKGLTSELTLTECLVKPLADRDGTAVKAFLTLLNDQPELPVVPVSRSVLLEAARLRAEDSLELADAIHVATAKLSGCSVFLSDDRRIRPSSELAVSSWTGL